MSQIKHPLVSIIIPVYNGSNFLATAIQSTLEQTYTNIEVIVVNDGSQDDGTTAKIAREYGEKIRYIEKKNGGVASALNYGIKHMRGEYFSCLSHDDFYAPEKIATQMQLLLSVTEPAVAFCGFTSVSTEGEARTIETIPERAQKDIQCALAVDPFVVLNGCTLLIPRIAFELCGTFDENLQTTQDYDLWWRIAEKFSFLYVDQSLVSYRLDTSQTNSSIIPSCLQKEDAIHAQMIASLPAGRIMQYYNNRTEELEKARTVYFDADHTASWYALTEKIGEAFSEHPQEILDFARKNILKCDYPENDQISRLLSQSKQKPRILFFCFTWVKGGVSHQVAQLSFALADAYDIIVVAVDGLSDETAFALEKHTFLIHLGQYNQDMATCLSLLLQRIVSLCALLRVDVLVGTPNYMSFFLPVYGIAKKTKLKTVAYNLGNYFFSYLYSTLGSNIIPEEEAYANADVAVFLTTNGVKAHSLYHPNTVRIPVTLPHFPQYKTHAAAKKHLLIMGRFYDEIKRIDRALYVFAKVLTKHPDTILTVVGKCDLDKHIPSYSEISIREIITSLNIPNSQLIIAGEVDSVIPFYEDASIFLLSSEAEGLPIVLLEAGLHSLPSVLFDIPGLEDLITDGVNGFLVKQGQLDEMADKICFLFENEAIRQKMGKEARISAERFSPEVAGARWRSLLDCVMNSKKEDIPDRLRAEFPVPDYPLERLAAQMLSVLDICVLSNMEKLAPATLKAPESTPQQRHTILGYGVKFFQTLKAEGIKEAFYKAIRKIKNSI